MLTGLHHLKPWDCSPPRTGVLHTIMFNRSLGQVKPQDVDSELFDITYVRHQTAAAAGVQQSRFPGGSSSYSVVSNRQHHGSSNALTLLHLAHMLA